MRRYMNIAKKIVLFFFGKRIRKEFFLRQEADGYKKFIESPLWEWSDRFWLLKRAGTGNPENRLLQFLREGIIKDD